MPISQQLLMDTSYYNALINRHTLPDDTLIHVIDLPQHVYASLRGHSDIFACSLGDKLILEPRVFERLSLRGAAGLIKGQSTIGAGYPFTAHYNALVTESFVIHNGKYTDQAVLQAAGERDRIQVRQGYARCTTLEIASGRFITSDKGILEALTHRHVQVDFIPGDTIQLTGQQHGFIGGCSGLDRLGRLWFYGSLTYHPFGALLKNICDQNNIEIIELIDAPLRDIGGLLFWDK